MRGSAVGALNSGCINVDENQKILEKYIKISKF